jgi:hypothetical protein
MASFSRTQQIRLLPNLGTYGRHNLLIRVQLIGTRERGGLTRKTLEKVSLLVFKRDTFFECVRIQWQVCRRRGRFAGIQFALFLRRQTRYIVPVPLKMRTLSRLHPTRLPNPVTLADYPQRACTTYLWPDHFTDGIPQNCLCDVGLRNQSIGTLSIISDFAHRTYRDHRCVFEPFVGH